MCDDTLQQIITVNIYQWDILIWVPRKLYLFKITNDIGWKTILNILKHPKEPTSQVMFYINNLWSVASLKILF